MYNTSCMTPHTHPKCCNYLIVGLNCGTRGARKDTREELLEPEPVSVELPVKVVFLTCHIVLIFIVFCVSASKAPPVLYSSYSTVRCTEQC